SPRSQSPRRTCAQVRSQVQFFPTRLVRRSPGRRMSSPFEEPPDTGRFDANDGRAAMRAVHRIFTDLQAVEQRGHLREIEAVAGARDRMARERRPNAFAHVAFRSE